VFILITLLLVPMYPIRCTREVSMKHVFFYSTNAEHGLGEVRTIVRTPSHERTHF